MGDQLLGEAPIDHERFPKRAEHDVGGLQVAMDDVAAMSKGDGVANADEPGEQVTKIERGEITVARLVKFFDRCREGFSLDEPHGIERAAVGMDAQPVHGYDAGVFQVARDFCLRDEAAATDWIVGGVGLNFLEGYVAMQFAIFGEKNLSEAALSVELDRFESR